MNFYENGPRVKQNNSILYGAAYYEEYAPYDRLRADVQMKAADINVVRIGESTWSTLEPHDGVFDYSHIDRVIQAMSSAGIHVIVGTPTYAIPHGSRGNILTYLQLFPRVRTDMVRARTWISRIPTSGFMQSASSAVLLSM